MPLEDKYFGDSDFYYNQLKGAEYGG